MEIEERHRVKFRPATIRSALARFTTSNDEDIDPNFCIMSIDGPARSTKHDDFEEWLADYRSEDCSRAYLHVEIRDVRIIIIYAFSGTTVQVRSQQRSQIEASLDYFASAAAEFPPPPAPPLDPEPALPPPVIFIGHGRSRDWRDLKDHLVDQHGYTVEAYETGSRAGHHIRDVLDTMLKRSSFALLVMTAEDEQGDGSLRTRQNVVHECGLFQGSLGFDRAVAVVEDGVEAFSNLDGIQQIRYERGRIREVFGDVLATLKREFPTFAP